MLSFIHCPFFFFPYTITFASALYQLITISVFSSLMICEFLLCPQMLETTKKGFKSSICKLHIIAFESLSVWLVPFFHLRL